MQIESHIADRLGLSPTSHLKRLGKSAYYALDSLMNGVSIGTLLLHAQFIVRGSTGPAGNNKPRYTGCGSAFTIYLFLDVSIFCQKVIQGRSTAGMKPLNGNIVFLRHISGGLYHLMGNCIGKQDHQARGAQLLPEASAFLCKNLCPVSM